MKNSLQEYNNFMFQLDNCGSFDNLAPLLPNDKFNFLAIDLLGHGFSSHYPPGMLYRFADSFMVIRYVKEHMKWDNFSFLSHSLGGIISTWYAAIFPEEVNRVISLDIVSVSPTKLNKQVQTTRKAVLSGIETFDKLSGNHEVPTYSYIDAVARAFMANQFHGVEYPITQEAVETLMKRGLRKVDEDKYTWTADLRLRIPATFNPLEEQVEQYSSNVKCPMMIIKASGSHYYMKEEMAKRIINVYKNHNPNFEIHNVIGGHHIHMTDPEKVIGLINDFLLKTDFVPPDEELLKRDNIPMDLF